MRRIFIFLTLYFSYLLSENIDVKTILKDMESLEKEKRSFSKIVINYDPFFPTKKDKKKRTVYKKQQKKSYKLKAILNKKAFINDRWFKLGERVGEYKIIKITSTKVVLEKGRKRKVLNFSSKSLLKIKDNKI